MLRHTLVLITALVTSGCALSPYNLGGTEQILAIGPRNPSIVKSLRCEIITFLVENKIRSAYWAMQVNSLEKERTANPDRFKEQTTYLKSLPYIDIDSKQYAAVQGDFKNIDTYTATLGIDWKYTLTPVTTYNDYHIGPSYTQTRTFESIQPIALPQNADLGSSKSWVVPNSHPTPSAAKFTTLYNRHAPEDEDFYCYSSFYESKAVTIEDALDDVQKLVVGAKGTEGLKNFTRTYVDGKTLAKWIQDQVSEMSTTYRTFQATPEAALPGQLEYAFTLDVKPGMDTRFNLVRTVVNPLVPELSGSLEHSTMFTIYLNTIYAVPSLTAKAGNSCVGVTQNGKCLPKQVPVSVLQ